MVLQMGKAFDIAAVFGDVPDSGTTKEQIEYIDIGLLDADPQNFYSLSGVDELAANIELCGLMDPLRVRPCQNGRFIIVSGHRRHAALTKLVSSGNDKFKQVPCIREVDGVPDALQQLRLIYANADTRRMSSADLSKQAQQVEHLLYELKEQGYDFPGRMRDHVAEACKVSKTKLANLKVIREGLDECWHLSYNKSDISEDAALKLARLSPEHQRKCYEHAGNKSSIKYYYANDVDRDSKFLGELDKLVCRKHAGGTPCSNANGKWAHICGKDYYYGDCAKMCCDKCEDLGTCKHACPMLADKIKKIKADKKEAKRQEKLAQEAKDEPVIRQIQDLWYRFGYARSKSGCSVSQVMSALKLYYSKSDDKKYKGLEDLFEPVTANTSLPYGYRLDLVGANALISLADLLGVSVDYLLCRTDVPGMAITDDADTWHSGPMPHRGWYACIVAVEGIKQPLRKFAWCNGLDESLYFKPNGEKMQAECLGWMPLPRSYYVDQEDDDNENA